MAMSTGRIVEIMSIGGSEMGVLGRPREAAVNWFFLCVHLDKQAPGVNFVPGSAYGLF